MVLFETVGERWLPNVTSSVSGGGADDIFSGVISYSIDGAVMATVAPKHTHGVCFRIHFPNPGSVVGTSRHEQIRLPFVRTPTNIPNNVSLHDNRERRLLMCSAFGNIGTRFDISKEKAIGLSQISFIKIQ